MLEDRTTKAQQMANKPNIGKRGSIVEANRSQINHSIPSLMKITVKNTSDFKRFI